MDLGLKGKVAIVTGASRGIGKATALELAKEGANVVVAGIDEYFDYFDNVKTRGENFSTVELEAVSGQIQDLGVQSIAIKADVSKKAETDSIVEQTLAKFGRIDICVNNAAVSIPEKFETSDEAHWNIHYEVCLLGIWYMCKAVLPVMKKEGWGRIINLSSGSTLFPFIGTVAYTAAKSGVIGLSKSLVTEYSAHGITVNSVIPGPTDTPMGKGFTERAEKVFGKGPEIAIPTGRMNRPEDLAYAICFLASKQAAQITGQSIVVSGGLIMH